MEKNSLEKVLLNANSKHNYLYDYSLIKDYTNIRVKYPIVCHQKDKNGLEHGVFWQNFGNHLMGQGCPKCRYIKSGNAKKISQELFDKIERLMS